MIEEIIQYYRVKIKHHAEMLRLLKKRIYHVGTIRLLWVVGMLTALWFLRDKEWGILLAVIGIGLFCFLFLVIYHTKLHHQRVMEEGLIRLFENELKGIDLDFSAFDGAPEQIDAQHAFCMDLDIFGECSLFQMMNRTVTQMGKERLINNFRQPLSGKTDILMIQDGVREMRELTDFRHRFYVTGDMAFKEKQDIKTLLSADNLRSMADNRWMHFLIWFVPAIWTLLITGGLFQWIPMSYLVFYVAISYLIVNLPFKHIQKVFASVNKTEKILQTYSKLMKQVEDEHFCTPLLKSAQTALTADAASNAIKRLSRTIGNLDQRFSLIGVILNLLYMRDTRQTMKLERWKQIYSGQINKWFDALGVFDVFCSYSSFAFNHPDYAYPTLTESYFRMEGKALGHPLIHRDKCVRNDLSIPKSKFFLIITGANMAGKSTFLRTVGVNFLLACMGLPVCAESLAVYPAQLVTSLRTADSLLAKESYFFAELKRLQMIINRLNAGEQLLIILDEILKGTNSVDKQKGSIALVKQLIHKDTCGIIATHDLLLGTLSDIFPDHVQNKRFEAEINGNDLSFSYQLRDGIAKNMNATFLMKRMGIFEKE